MTARELTSAGSTLQTALAGRSGRYFLAACAAAVGFGIFVPISPWCAVGWLAVIPLSFAAPVGALTTMVAITVLMPFELQDRLSITGGRDEPGLLVVDVLMVLGLIRVYWLVIRGRLAIDVPLFVATVLGASFAAWTLWGIGRGADISAAGAEGRRALLAVSAFIMAWPLLAEEKARRRLVWGLMIVGVGLGMWGFAQFAIPIKFSNMGDVGLRDGLGVGQLQGGLFAYPIAVILAWAALVVGQVRSAAVKGVLVVVFLANAICVVLTFERSIWVSTFVACIFVVVSSGALTSRLALRYAGAVAVFMVTGGALASTIAGTVMERLGSVSDVASSNSLKHRILESQAVFDEHISAHPIVGSGFGATVTWGLDNVFRTSTDSFVDVGYVWLVWKIGIPAALFLVVILIRAILRRPRGEEAQDTREWYALRKGSQASILAMLLVSTFFAPFNALGITATIGLLVAVCYSASAPVQLKAVDVGKSHRSELKVGGDRGH